MDSITCRSINRGSCPGRTTSVHDFQIEAINVGCGELNGATHARASISPRVAVAVVGRGAGYERSENRVDDGTSARVWPGLEASVSDVLLINELELLGKVVAGPMRGLADSERESDVLQPGRRNTYSTPFDPNEGKDC